FGADARARRRRPDRQGQLEFVDSGVVERFSHEGRRLGVHQLMTRSASRHSVPGDHLRARHVVRAVASVLAALLSITLLVAFGYGWKKYGDLNAGLQTFKLNALNQVPAHGDKSASIQKNGSAQNILIVGLDDRTGLTPQQVKEFHTGTDATDST